MLVDGSGESIIINRGFLSSWATAIFSVLEDIQLTFL
jgi:hypothetical protein